MAIDTPVCSVAVNCLPPSDSQDLLLLSSWALPCVSMNATIPGSLRTPLPFQGAQLLLLCDPRRGHLTSPSLYESLQVVVCGVPEDQLVAFWVLLCFYFVTHPWLGLPSSVPQLGHLGDWGTFMTYEQM